MPPTILNDLIPQIDRTALLADLRVKPDRPVPPEIDELIVQALHIGRPKGVYLLAGIQSKTEQSVTLEGVRLSSRVLRVNLDRVHRAFPYLVTAGTELEGWAKSNADPLRRFYTDLIQEQVLHNASRQLAEVLERTYNPGPLSAMHPGSLEDWPITEQIPLFSLFGETAAEIGVSLTDSLLMTPTKTVSGIYFASEVSFASCMLCPREVCSNRQAAFDPDLFARRYASEAAGG